MWREKRNLIAKDGDADSIVKVRDALKAAKGKGGFLEGVSQEVAVALAPRPKRN